MPGYRVAEAIADMYREDPARYAWVIDFDHLSGPDGYNEAGITGPSNAPPGLLKELADGYGIKYRIFDDDGELYYTGRIVHTDPSDFDDEAEFGPLWDFGAPNAGATEIRYHDGTRWVAL